MVMLTTCAAAEGSPGVAVTVMLYAPGEMSGAGLLEQPLMLAMATMQSTADREAHTALLRRRSGTQQSSAQASTPPPSDMGITFIAWPEALMLTVDATVCPGARKTLLWLKLQVEPAGAPAQDNVTGPLKAAFACNDRDAVEEPVCAIDSVEADELDRRPLAAKSEAEGLQLLNREGVRAYAEHKIAAQRNKDTADEDFVDAEWLAFAGDAPQTIQALQRLLALHDPESLKIPYNPAYDFLRSSATFRNLTAQLKRMTS